MFNLLEGVPRAVSDALGAACMSSAESASESIRCVSLEIEKTFHEVPPSVKDALAAAVSSLGATWEENLATLYLCFSDEFDKIKNEHEHCIAVIKSENKSLKLRLEHQSNQLNNLLAKQQTQKTLVSRMYHQTNNFAQALPGCDRNDNHGDQKTTSTLATKFSSHREASTNEEVLPSSVAIVNQLVEAHIADRRNRQTQHIHETQTERNQKHHHHQKSSRTIIRRIGPMLSCFPESSSTSVSPSIAQQSHAHVWNQSFHELSEYKKRFGNCNVPLTFSEKPSLGIWVNDQRLQYRNGLVGKTPSLTAFQIRCLQTIGFQWASVFDVSWEERFRQLVEFKHKSRDCNAPTKSRPNLSLGKWIASQRKKYRTGQLTNEKIKQLEGIGFIW